VEIDVCVISGFSKLYPSSHIWPATHFNFQRNNIPRLYVLFMAVFVVYYYLIL